jgi:hypothetical protein
MNFHTKQQIALSKRVTPRTVDNWVEKGWLSAPIKFGTSQQARVRWTDEQVADLDRTLAAFSARNAA